MIREVRLENYRAHVDTRLQLTPLHVLVGPNASGKSSVLGALAALARLEEGSHLPPNFGGCVRRGARPQRLALTTKAQSLAGEPWSLGVVVEEADASQGERTPWTVTVHRSSGGREETLPLGIRQGSRVFPGTLMLALQAAAIAAPSPAATSSPALSRDGAGLATVLAHLMTSAHKRYDEMVEACRKVIPVLREIRVAPVPIEHTIRSWVAPQHVALDEGQQYLEKKTTIAGYELQLEIGGSVFSAADVSEGTLIVVALMTALWSQEPARLVLIDDIDRGLHPGAQRELMGLLRKVIATVPGLQIIATTHSPYLVDALEPEEVSVLVLDPDGRAHAAPLSSAPDAARALEVMHSGELWSAEGEAWVLAAAGAQ